jgi:GMP synthase (glutamine-hydrolysing) A subunit
MRGSPFRTRLIIGNEQQMKSTPSDAQHSCKPQLPGPRFRTKPRPMSTHASILIVDFGSQVTQLIARRVRETGVYCEIHPFQSADAAFARLKPRAVILSGGPASVTEAGSPRAPKAVFESGLPIMAICYGQQTTAVQLGGVVEGGHAAEFGRADVIIKEKSALFDGVWEVGAAYPVWMSHGDRVTERPSPSPRTRRGRSTPPCSTPRWCTRRMAAS